jgi:hypothetical protein
LPEQIGQAWTNGAATTNAHAIAAQTLAMSGPRSLRGLFLWSISALVIVENYSEVPCSGAIKLVWMSAVGHPHQYFSNDKHWYQIRADDTFVVVI